jgi:hypothetical protein
MGRSIYRSDTGRDAIRAWCELRLEAAGATSRELDTTLGPTRVTTVGGGPDVVLLPGTNFSTATSLKLLVLVGREYRAIGVDCLGSPGSRRGNVPAIAMPSGFGSAKSLVRSPSSVPSSLPIRLPGAPRCSLPGATSQWKVSCSSPPLA